MATFFIADMHLGHKNCLTFDARPFITIEEHDKALVENWNRAVSPADEVWVLGDISWRGPEQTAEIIRALNGKINLVRGNHDEKLLRNHKVQALFTEVVDYKELYINIDSPKQKTMCALSHYPIPCFNKHYYGAYHLYGHVHSSFEYNMMENVKRNMEELYTVPCNMYNVGAMMPWINYTPRTLEQIVAKYNSYHHETSAYDKKSAATSNLSTGE